MELFTEQKARLLCRAVQWAVYAIRKWLKQLSKRQKKGGFEAVKEAVFGASEDAVNIMGKIQKNGGKCTYMMFGSNLKAPHHSSEFDFDEKTIGIMTECYCRTIEKLMCKNKEEKA